MEQTKYEHLRVSPSADVEGIAVITMCKPKVNALGVELMTELTKALDTLAKDTSVKGALLVSGFPTCYCGGLDLNGANAQCPPQALLACHLHSHC